MPMAEFYRRQAALLIGAIPLVAAETCFALKGGTAINLFVRDMPRLSVDIDLTYLPIADRVSSLAAIDAAMRRISASIARGIPGAGVTPVLLQIENCVTRLLIHGRDAQIKIEVTPVLRGCVYEPAVRPVTSQVEDRFGFAEIQVVSFPDLYAGKIVAALDRQHPRDLFDVMNLLANEGITDEIRKAFIIYVLSHNRPMSEVLAPGRQDITAEFDAGFDGMSDSPVALDDLLRAREELIAAIVGNMPAEHRRFLVSIKRGEPDWTLLDLPGAERLPAVRWRIENLKKLDARKRSALVEKLSAILGV